MANIIINSDFKLKNGGRKAPAMTKDDLINIFMTYVNKNDLQEEYEIDDMSDEEIAMAVINYMVEEDDPKLTGDIKYTLSGDTEFNICDGGPMYGFVTLANGFTFFGFSWHDPENAELPFLSICYYDGKNLRIFQPTYGNFVNKDSKEPLCTEYDDDEDYIKKYGFADWDDLCKSDSVNNAAMTMEIQSRIEITGTFTATDTNRNTYYFRICTLQEIPMFVPNYQAMVVCPKAFFDQNGYLYDQHIPKLESTMIRTFGWGGSLTEAFLEVNMSKYKEDDFIKKMANAGYTMIPNPSLPA